MPVLLLPRRSPSGSGPSSRTIICPSALTQRNCVEGFLRTDGGDGEQGYSVMHWDACSILSNPLPPKPHLPARMASTLSATLMWMRQRLRLRISTIVAKGGSPLRSLLVLLL